MTHSDATGRLIVPVRIAAPVAGFNNKIYLRRFHEDIVIRVRAGLLPDDG